MHGSGQQADVDPSAHPDGIDNQMRSVPIAGSVHGLVRK